MSPLNRWIEKFHSRILLGEFLHSITDALAIFLFVFGSAVLAVRLGFPQLWPHVLWVLICLAPLSACSWWWARKQLQPRHVTVAMLDQSLSAGGLLMTLEERPDSKWSQELPQLNLEWDSALPRVYPRRFLAYLTAPTVFAIAVCFVPLREARSTPVQALQVATDATARLEALKETLDHAQLLKQEEKEQIQQEIEKIQQESKDTPLSHENWETLDALQERLQLRVNEAAAKSQKFHNAVSRLADLGKGMDQKISQQEKEQLEQDVEEALDELFKKNKEALGKLPQGKEARGREALQKRLEQLVKNGKLQLPSDPQERKELLDQLKQELDKEKKKLDELRKKARERGQRGEGDREEGEQGEGNQPGNQAGEEEEGEPGQGGTQRGRGDAEMNWGDEADAKKMKFKEILLPPGFLDKPKDQIAGIQTVAPNDDPAAIAAKRALQANTTSLGDATWERRLSPRHRNIVKQYFGSEPRKK